MVVREPLVWGAEPPSAQGLRIAVLELGLLPYLKPHSPAALFPLAACSRKETKTGWSWVWGVWEAPKEVSFWPL